MTNFKRIYQSLDNYDEFVKTYRLSKEENFNENLIFKKIEDSGMSHIEATHLQNHVKFLLSKKPSAQLTAMLIAQGVEVDICPVQDEGSIYLKAAMDGKNSYVIYQLLKYIDMDIIVDTLIKADKKEMLKDFHVNEKFYISVLANILKKYSQTINNSQETHQDIDFYKSLMKKRFLYGNTGYLFGKISRKYKKLNEPTHYSQALQQALYSQYHGLFESVFVWTIENYHF